LDNKILKIAGLNIGIVGLNIALLSKGLVNIFNAGDFGKAIGFTAVIMSVIVFFYGNYKLISQKPKPVKLSESKSPEEYIRALQQVNGKKTFDNDIAVIIDQIQRLSKKKEKIRYVLKQKFNVIDKVYERFDSSISDVEYVFFENIKSIVNKIDAFDEDEYGRISKGAQRSIDRKFIETKISIFNEYISFVKNAVEDNEEIILKLDALLLEISKIDSIEEGQIENMSEIKGLDELIKKSRNY